MALQQTGANISVQKTFYNDSQMTDMNSLANALLSKPTELSPIITHLAGKDDKRFPLSFLTEGVGNVKSMDRLEYEYRVRTHARKTRPVQVTVSDTSNVGLGGSAFELVFPDKFFVFPYVLVNSKGEQARIMKEPTPVSAGNGYKYTLQLVNPAPSATLSAGYNAGDLWAQLYAPVGVDFSRGNASNWETPGLVRNKIGTVRKSYHMSGHARDYVVEFGLPTKGGKMTKLWMDYEEYQHMLNFKEECEMFYWYGQKTYNGAGNTAMKDENGMREFDEALKGHFTNTTTSGGSWKVGGENRFITGSGRSLGMTGYFTSYEHIDGHTVNVVKLPLFDHGPVAQAAGKHPDTGFSLESYRMVFVDQSNYDGQANLQMLSKKGREMMRWCVAGSVVPRGFDSSSSRASDVDGASVHMLKTAGIVLKRFDTSLDITCTAS
jgi:hypothetical protein